jgi:enoyl-CoA hydratase
MAHVTPPSADPTPLPDEVRLDADGPVRVITLHRPAKLNAANYPMQRGFVDAWLHIAADPEARAVVVTGAGRAFSAGGDASVLDGVTGDVDDLRAEFELLTDRTLRAVLECPLPVIAAVNGLAVGYGAGIVATCDFVVMAEDAYLQDPHARFGLPASPGCALVWPALTSRVVAKELLMLGPRISAADAYRVGLANRVVPAGEALAIAVALAHELAALPPSGVVAVKRAMNRDLVDAIDRRRSTDAHDAMDSAETQRAVADLVTKLQN